MGNVIERHPGQAWDPGSGRDCGVVTGDPFTLV